MWQYFIKMCFLSGFLYGVTLSAEPDDPVKFNKETIDKLRTDFNNKPLIARKLSQNPDTKEFLEQNSHTDPLPPESPAENSPEMPVNPIPDQPSLEVPINQPPSEIPDKHPSEIPPEALTDTPQEPPEDIIPHSEAAQPPIEADNPQPEPLSKEELDNALHKAKMDAQKKAAEKKQDKSQISYTKKTVIFYRKECQLTHSCIKVPVMTNLKSVIFEYNQGRYSVHSVKLSSQTR